STVSSSERALVEPGPARRERGAPSADEPSTDVPAAATVLSPFRGGGHRDSSPELRRLGHPLSKNMLRTIDDQPWVCRVRALKTAPIAWRSQMTAAVETSTQPT